MAAGSVGMEREVKHTRAAFPVPLRSPALGLSVALFGEGVANLEAFVTFPHLCAS